MILDNDVYIFGTGGAAREAEYLCNRANISVIAFVDKFNVGKVIHGIDIIHDNEYDPKYKAVVSFNSPQIRKKLCEWVENIGGSLATLVDSSVIITSPHTTKIGKGAIICAGSILSCDVTIGNSCYINMLSTVGHETILGDYVTMAAGVIISGNVTIGNECYIGNNCSIREYINICSRTILGMGTVVVKDITEPGTYIGIPARRLKC